ncbi:SDR family NAD(P)-dependent oxidoreductase [Sporosarcina sp. P1]|uniref:SDR family NAD(P)-dependent oxidoreductase n=1 Tax=Sporosarcina sp. P1 TaxID=2048257 RepID=UPI000C166722|nr:glucose 1-dehydrogenase [Sporosarcina sp. P1]PIC83008.1 short-chain dehydrogenase [Sporosarcina sp. P1]
MERLKGKTAVITGGATGIGRETALLFAKEGAQVAITDIDEAAGQNTLEELRQITGQATFIKHDVSSEADWITVAAALKARFSRVDILFNNAGVYVIKPIREIELETWNRVMSINVTGVFLGIKHIVPLMETAGGGSIINASSIAGLIGGPGHSLYGASKGAVRIMTKDAAAEYAKSRIRVNSIHPGYITTGMVDYASETSGKTPEELAAAYPLGRMGTADEVSRLVLFLASDESSFCTGSEFVIDGGAVNIL